MAFLFAASRTLSERFVVIRRHSQKKFHGYILHTQAPRRIGADLCEDYREARNAIQVLHGLGVALERAMGQSARSHPLRLVALHQ